MGTLQIFEEAKKMGRNSRKKINLQSSLIFRRLEVVRSLPPPRAAEKQTTNIILQSTFVYSARRVLQSVLYTV